MGLFGTVLVVLVILKLAGLIYVGWVWILAPIWIPVAGIAVLSAVGHLWDNLRG